MRSERLVREKAIQMPFVALGAEKAREVKDKAQQWVNQRLASDNAGVNAVAGNDSGESSEAATPATGLHLGGILAEQGKGWKFSGKLNRM
jgi:hypothetical protein